MIELIRKYRDLGIKIPESLFLIDKYKRLFELIDKKKNNDNNKYSKYK